MVAFRACKVLRVVSVMARFIEVKTRRRNHRGVHPNGNKDERECTSPSPRKGSTWIIASVRQQVCLADHSKTGAQNRHTPIVIHQRMDRQTGGSERSEERRVGKE